MLVPPLTQLPQYPVQLKSRKGIMHSVTGVLFTPAIYPL